MSKQWKAPPRGPGGRAAKAPASTAEWHPFARRALEPLAALPEPPTFDPGPRAEGRPAARGGAQHRAGADPTRRAQAGAVT